MNNPLNTFLAEIVFAKPYFLWLLLALPLLWFRFRDRRLVVHPISERERIAGRDESLGDVHPPGRE